jgi:hypothetical protein
MISSSTLISNDDHSPQSNQCTLKPRSYLPTKSRTLLCDVSLIENIWGGVSKSMSWIWPSCSQFIQYRPSEAVRCRRKLNFPMSAQNGPNDLRACFSHLLQWLINLHLNFTFSPSSPFYLPFTRKDIPSLNL